MSRPRRIISAPWVDLCAAILERAPRLPGALCRGRPELFDGHDDASRAEAIGQCQVCPALAACSDWVAATSEHQRPPGVIGGRFRRTVNRRQVS